MEFPVPLKPSKISVVVLVYNHAPYLEKALAGIEMQEFEGDLEVIIHDDASTDSSSDIYLNYKNCSRHDVKVIRQSTNKYRCRISFWPEIMSICTGQYVAM